MQIRELSAAARFFGILPFYLRSPVQLGEAHQLIRNRLASRLDLFLDRLRHDVFEGPAENPYLQLMRHAGVQLGDAEWLIGRQGLEETLRQFLKAGIYLTVDEFKGRTPIRRGALCIDVEPEQLRSPRAAYHLRASSGGSRSRGTPVLIDLRFVHTCAANCLVCLETWNGKDWITADWETPGAGARFRLTKFGMSGAPPEAWFTQIDPEDPSLPRVLRWNSRALRWASFISGKCLPSPVFSPLDDPEPVVRWLESVLKLGRTPLLFTFPGSAVRACITAARRNITIEGAKFLLGGEPITAARIETVRRAGCAAIPRYGTMECGAIGYGCPRGDHPDEVHLLEHMYAMIQAGDNAAALQLPMESLFITALHARSPFLMLNVSVGDQAVMLTRSCGCGWEQAGLNTHLHSVRSFEKLTSGGVTFFATEVIGLLETILPAAFGGFPTDYQLVEEESEDGEPLVTLRVHPALGPIDEARVVETFLANLAAGSAASALMTRRWRDATTVRVIRQPPLMSRAGKILHLQVDRTS